MCGIAGFSGAYPESFLEAMGRMIAHRGPDDAGAEYLADRGIGLVHRRLSIIDTSPAGHQPMWDSERRAVIVFNGEIYNFHELRAALVAAGRQFRSGSDTEVLVHGYLEWGEHLLERLNGIFAFAIWDESRRQLLLARDGVGVKPLYLAQTRSGVLFASELKALLLAQDVDTKIDEEAIYYFLSHLWCPAPRTIVSGIKKLRPGHALLVADGRVVREWQFYDLPVGVQKPRPAAAIAAEVRAGVEEAVRRQLISDVPVGAFLSGGLDSSAVVAMAKKHCGPSRLQCFTIDFEGNVPAAEGMTRDLPFARQVAAHLGVDLHEVRVGPNMIDRLEEMVFHLDEPQADPAPLNVLFISELARSMGIKVLLSGGGGDDIFSGYRRHLALGRERYWVWLPSVVRRLIRQASMQLPTGNALPRRIRKAFQNADRDGNDRIASYFLWIDPQWLERLLPSSTGWRISGKASPALSQALDALPPAASDLEKMLYLEGKYFLADHNLNYTDKMSMAAGVEVRVPLLDKDLIELAASIPDEFKQRGRVGKWIFKKAMETILPHQIIYRPKTGFGAPLRYWLRNQLRDILEETLSYNSISRRGLFAPGPARQLIRDSLEGRVDGDYTVFAMLCMELWCRRFLDSRPAM